MFTLFKTLSYNLTLISSLFADGIHITTFSLLVRLSDGALSDSATFTINLTDVDEDSTTTNQAPTITAATYSLAENSPTDGIGMVEASDPDGDTLTYTIVSGNDAEAFSLDSESGELTVSTSSALDFETTPTYSLGIEVSDGALSDLAIFTINLTDVDGRGRNPFPSRCFRDDLPQSLRWHHQHQDGSNSKRLRFITYRVKES